MSLIRTNNRTLDGNQGRRNLVYNGKFQVAQRGTDFDTITHQDYCLDRWVHHINGLDGNCDVDQTTTVPTAQGFSNSIKISMDASETSLDAGDYCTVQQYFEGQDLQHLLKGTSNAKKLCLSFWVRSSVASTYTIELKDADNTRNIGQSYTISTADTWEKKVIVFDGDTTGTLDNDNALSLQLIFWIDAGSTFTSGTFSTAWQAQTNSERVYNTTGWLESTSPEFYLTGVQMEVGDNPSDFEHRTYGEELLLCQRYYVQMCDSTAQSSISYGRGAGSGQNVVGAVPIPVPLRASPTLTSSGTYHVSDSNSRTSATPSSVTVSAFQSTTTNLGVYWAFGSTVCDDDRVCLVGGNGSVTIGIDAEL